MSDELLTPADVAERMKLTEAQVLTFRRKHNWPCVPLSRKTIRFTEEQVAEIVEKHSAAPTPAPEIPAAFAGQTRGSRRRRSA